MSKRVEHNTRISLLRTGVILAALVFLLTSGLNEFMPSKRSAVMNSKLVARRACRPALEPDGTRRKDPTRSWVVGLRHEIPRLIGRRRVCPGDSSPGLSQSPDDRCRRGRDGRGSAPQWALDGSALVAVRNGDLGSECGERLWDGDWQGDPQRGLSSFARRRRESDQGVARRPQLRVPRRRPASGRKDSWP